MGFLLGCYSCANDFLGGSAVCVVRTRGFFISWYFGCVSAYFMVLVSNVVCCAV